MTEENQPSIDWSRIYALPYNHFFKDKVKQMRLYLGLPENGFSNDQKAWEWLEKHLTEQQSKPWYFQKPASLDEKLWETEVPLLKAAIYLILESGLPLRMRSNIGLYIVTNNEKYLTNWRGLNITVAPNMKSARVQLAITVDGIDEWTTEQQWREVWEHWVKPGSRMLGEPVPPNKRPGYGKKLQERIKRYAEWYQLSELDGLGPAEALKIWDKHYPNEAGNYNESTVSKAVSRFGKLITPISL